MASGVRIITYRRPAGIKGRLLQMFRLYRLAANVDAAVYHCNEVDSWLVGVCLRLLRGKGCVFDVHEHYPSTFAESRFHRRLQPAVAASVRAVFRVLTPFTHRFVLAKRSVSADFHCAESKKLLVQNFTPLAGIQFAQGRAATDDDGWTTIVHLGLFSKPRGWPQVLDALARMRNQRVRLVVIGEINDGSGDEFHARLIALGLTGRVVVHKWMPFDAAFALLCQAQIGLIAFQPGTLNHVYAMPHKMFDYMAAGLAVVCPNFAVEVAPVVAESHCGLLVNPADRDALAQVFDRLVDDPASTAEMGRRGQLAVRERYNWETEVAPLVTMYQNWKMA